MRCAAGAAAGTVLAAATVVTGLARFGITCAIRGGKERKFKRNMSTCLTEYGHEVTDWEKLKKRDDTAAFAARQVKVAKSIRPQPAEAEVIEAVCWSMKTPADETPAPLAVGTLEG